MKEIDYKILKLSSYSNKINLVLNYSKIMEQYKA